jgi:hypothetical protein
MNTFEVLEIVRNVGKTVRASPVLPLALAHDAYIIRNETVDCVKLGGSYVCSMVDILHIIQDDLGSAILLIVDKQGSNRAFTLGGKAVNIDSVGKRF